MRKFELINELGQSFGLNDIRTGFMQNPTGLGYSMEYAFVKMGTSWKQQYMRDTQSTITGEIVFGTESPYEAQTSFLEFIRSSKNIMLKRTTEAGTHYKDVEITRYDISEIGNGNVLNCPIEMIATSLWYANKSEKAIVIQSEDAITRYSYRFPSRFNDQSTGYYEVNNNGSVSSGFMLEFYGAIDNPVVVLKVNDTELSKLEIDTSITSAQRILFSSIDGKLFCYKGSIADIENFKITEDATNLTNLALDFSLDNENFFKLPIGTSRLEFEADSSLVNPIVITTYKYYRAV